MISVSESSVSGRAQCALAFGVDEFSGRQTRGLPSGPIRCVALLVPVST